MIRGLCTFAGALCALAASAGADSYFHPLLFEADGPVALSADGHVLAGTRSTPQGAQLFRWTPDGGAIVHAFPPSHSYVRAVSGDGSVIVGRNDMIGAFRWTTTYGLQALNAGIEVRDISFDGTVVVGTKGTVDSTESAYRWTATTGSVELGNLHGIWPGFSRGNAVSDDGLVVVGASTAAFLPGYLEAFRWTPQSLMVSLGRLPGASGDSIGNAVSADGAVVVGESSSSNGYEAFRWSSLAGMVGLGDLPGPPFASRALAASADGSVVVGVANYGSASQAAFIWSATHGMRSLRDVLSGIGVDGLSGWALTWGFAISHDGKTIAGLGLNPCGVQQPWLARLDGPPEFVCRADVNGDTVLTVQDVFDFLVAYFSGDPSGDFNSSCDSSVQDVFEFLAAYFTGCP